MFYTTEKFWGYKLVKGIGISEPVYRSCDEDTIKGEKLISFDRALLNAGVGDYNLIKMSSILPRGCEISKEQIGYAKGSCIPIAYASITRPTWKIKKRYIKANVAVGVPKNVATNGLIMENSGESATREPYSINMIMQNMEYRGHADIDIKSSSIYYDIQTDTVYCEQDEGSDSSENNLLLGLDCCITLFAAVILLDYI
jgi:arginine decarboxylase